MKAKVGWKQILSRHPVSCVIHFISHEHYSKRKKKKKKNFEYEKKNIKKGNHLKVLSSFNSTVIVNFTMNESISVNT